MSGQPAPGSSDAAGAAAGGRPPIDRPHVRRVRPRFCSLAVHPGARLRRDWRVGRLRTGLSLRHYRTWNASSLDCLGRSPKAEILRVRINGVRRLLAMTEYIVGGDHAAHRTHLCGEHVHGVQKEDGSDPGSVSAGHQGEVVAKRSSIGRVMGPLLVEEGCEEILGNGLPSFSAKKKTLGTRFKFHVGCSPFSWRCSWPSRCRRSVREMCPRPSKCQKFKGRRLTRRDTLVQT